MSAHHGGAFDGLLARLRGRLEPASLEPQAEPGVTHAAVMLLLRGGASGEGEILFIKRAERQGDPWSGHLALPGGRAEPRDPTVLDAALRETAEEVGIDVAHGGTVLGRLATVHPLSARLPPIAVTPYVAVAPAGAVSREQAEEVEAAFWLPLETLRRGGMTDVVRRVVGGEVREWRAYPSPRGPIWGITERILTRFLELASAAAPPQ